MNLDEAIKLEKAIKQLQNWSFCFYCLQEVEPELYERFKNYVDKTEQILKEITNGHL